MRQVIQPVGDIDEAVHFYSVAFDFGVRFVDGSRFAALDAGSGVLALASAEEDVALTSAPAIKVSDLDAFLARLATTDGGLVRGPEDGPHERRAVVCDPWGNRIIVYSAN
jgi:predicted enzyme related to lactoylglutathione lyase